MFDGGIGDFRRGPGGNAAAVGGDLEVGEAGEAQEVACRRAVIFRPGRAVGRNG